VVDRQLIDLILQAVDIRTLESKVFSSSSKSSKSTQPQNDRWTYPRPESLILVLVHDHLFSSRGISLAKIHKIRGAIERHSSALKSELARLMVQRAVSRVSDLLDSLQPQTNSSDADPGLRNTNSPRWMRVNSIRWCLQDATEWFTAAGWTQVSLEDLTNQPSASTAQILMFAVDEHIADLLALPSRVVLAKLAPYLDGRLIAQDKASCIPAQLLLGDHPQNLPIHVIDATAAPGNKTTMLSSIVGSRGKVWAFEKDKQRFKVLSEMVKLAGCTSKHFSLSPSLIFKVVNTVLFSNSDVQCIHGDFLAVDPCDERFKNVSHIMVDPSCCKLPPSGPRYRRVCLHVHIL
jgi:putative methyltransferase